MLLRCIITTEKFKVLRTHFGELSIITTEYIYIGHTLYQILGVHKLLILNTKRAEQPNQV